MEFIEFIFLYYLLPLCCCLIGTLLITIIDVINDNDMDVVTIGDIIDEYKNDWLDGNDIYPWLIMPGSNLVILIFCTFVCVFILLTKIKHIKIFLKIGKFIKWCFKQITKSIKWCFNIITLPFRLLWYKFRSIRIK